MNSQEKAIPATILTGFLGAGKTTFLNYILQKQKQYKVAVIVNEIGAVNIDADLIDMADENMVEMTNGCICCSIRTDLIQSIVKLLKKAKFDYLVVETTGLADPGPVAQTFFNVRELHQYVKLDSVITMVDAVNFFDQIKASPTTIAQVEMGDFLILNKVDQATPEQIRKVRKALTELNPHATIHEADHGKIDLNGIWDVHAFDIQPKLEKRPDLLDETVHHHDESIKASTLTYDGEFELDKLEAFVQELSQTYRILRAKGIVNVTGGDRKAVFHGVNDRYTLYWEKPWKEGEERKSVFVFIGKDIDLLSIENKLAKCKASSKR